MYLVLLNFLSIRFFIHEDAKNPRASQKWQDHYMLYFLVFAERSIFAAFKIKRLAVFHALLVQASPWTLPSPWPRQISRWTNIVSEKFFNLMIRVSFENNKQDVFQVHPYDILTIQVGY